MDMAGKVRMGLSWQGVAGWINQLVRKVPTWVVYLALAAPAPWLFVQGLNGQLGPDPVKALEHAYGELALQL